MKKWIKRIYEEGVTPFEMCVTMILGFILWVIVSIK